MADSYAELIIGEGDSATVTPLTEEQFNDLPDLATGQLQRVHILFIPEHVINSGHYPPNPCTPIPVFMFRGRFGQARQTFQGCQNRFL